MSGGLINTKRIGTGYCYNINNGNENSALYFNSFTQTGGTINISKDPETTYPAGIGNTYCIAGNYSINNTSSTYLSNPNSIPRTQLQSTIITKTGGTILLDGKAVDESRMFLTGMSGKLDDGSDPKYLVINS
jgi:hypothetical protein